MDHITVSQGQEPDPEIVELAEPILAVWEAGILRVAAARANPDLMSFRPAPDSVERILSRRLRSLPNNGQDTATRRAVRQLSVQRLRGRLALDRVDLTQPHSVAALYPFSAAPQRTRRQIEAVAQVGIRRPAGGQVAAVPGSASTALTLEMLRMVCVDETNGFLGSEVGEDEISLGGVALDAAVNVGAIGPLDLGDFNDWGNLRQKDYQPPRPLFTFDLTQTPSFPASLFATLVLVEVDQGNVSETVREIVEKVKEQAIEYLSALIGSAVGSTGGPLGTVIGAIVGYVVGKIVGKIISIWEDDAFEVRTLEIHLPSAGATFEGSLTQPSRVVRFKGPGHYAMRYQWRLTRPAQPAVASERPARPRR